MSLPIIKKPNQIDIFSNKDITYKENDLSNFDDRLKKVSEIKIYLKPTFHISDIDDLFMSSLNEQFACLYLEKMGIISSQFNIKMLLKSKSLDECDFQLSIEIVRGKQLKVLHIFPNSLKSKNSKNFKVKSTNKALSSEEFEKEMIKTKGFIRQTNEEVLNEIKNRKVSFEEECLMSKKIINDIILKEIDVMEDKKVYIESKGMIEQQVKGFDFSIENIRRKYLMIEEKNNEENEEVSGKAKFRNFDKVKKNEIINNPKFEFPFLDIDLTKEIIEEVNKPIQIPIEVIMKDVLYILDNFPIEGFVSLNEPVTKRENIENKSFSYLKNEKNKEKIHVYKLKTITKEDILYVYKKLQSNRVYRIIGLVLNLIYWILFGFINRIQIDKYTKNYILNKVLGELTILSDSFNNKSLYNKLFMPLLILIIKIESESVFINKYKKLFSSYDNNHKGLSRITDLITRIFDPNAYFSLFLIGKPTSKKKILPNYKKKINATSNLINQLFTTYQNEKNVKRQKGKEEVIPNQLLLMGEREWEEEKEYIINSKVEFYRILLDRINNNLKKRNLHPVFNVNENDYRRFKS